MPKQREIKQELTFKEKGTFESYYAAERWLHENSFEYGSMDAGNPIAIQLDNYTLPQKWHNFDAEDKSLVDGIMTSTDWREGEVKVIIYK
jgi:hypothetical protein